MAVRKRKKKRRVKRRAKRTPKIVYTRSTGERRTIIKSAALRGRTPYEELNLQRSLAKSYEEQLDEIGDVLVKHGVISRAAIERDGVRFAVINRFEPMQGAYEAKRPRR